MKLLNYFLRINIKNDWRRNEITKYVDAQKFGEQDYESCMVIQAAIDKFENL